MERKQWDRKEKEYAPGVGNPKQRHKNIRRIHSADFNGRLTLETINGIITVPQIASE